MKIVIFNTPHFRNTASFEVFQASSGVPSIKKSFEIRRILSAVCMIQTGESGYTREKNLFQFLFVHEKSLRIFPYVICIQYCLVLDMCSLSLAVIERTLQILLENMT
jgi:hypothetical protein